jgi:hypothetical protein
MNRKENLMLLYFLKFWLAVFALTTAGCEIYALVWMNDTPLAIIFAVITVAALWCQIPLGAVIERTRGDD